MQATEIPDLRLIRQTAKARRKAEGRMTYMQYLDQAARDLYGVRHFHEARARVKRASADTVTDTMAMSPLQYYLHSLQEYYLDF